MGASKHLKDINESYLTHAKYALRIWGHALVIVLVLPIHALLPDILVHTASNHLEAIKRLQYNRTYNQMKRLAAKYPVSIKHPWENRNV